MKTVHQPEYRILIECLKDARRNANLTQDELAELLGMDQTHISKIEIRERRIDVIELRKICMALGLSLVDFIQMFEDKLLEHQQQAQE